MNEETWLSGLKRHRAKVLGGQLSRGFKSHRLRQMGNAMIYRFYKNEQGWFIDLPHYPFSKAHLAMVKGADVLLEQLAEDKNEIWFEVSTQPISQYTDVLDRVKKLGIAKGAIYKGNLIKINHSILEENNLWLCPVTLFVFLHYPEKIYYKKI